MKPSKPIQSTCCTARRCPARDRRGKTLLSLVFRSGGAAALFASLLAFLAGCASESKLLREDPAFTAASLRSGGLAVLGVVQVDEVPQGRPPLIDALERVLSGSRGDIPLVPARDVRGALGDSAARLFLLGYQLRGDPDSIWLDRAAASVRARARYGVLARVEGTSVRYGTRDVPSSDATGEGELSLRVTGRDARIQVTVYDLTTRGIVFRGKFVGGTDEATNLRPPPADTLNPDSLPPQPRPTQVFRQRGAGFPTPGPSDSPSDLGYPDAPTVARAAESAFLSFARSLPGGPAPR